MISWLQGQGFEFHFSKGYPDYYPSLNGAFGKGSGRTIESKVFNTKKLGRWRSRPPPSDLPVAIYTNDAPLFSCLTSSLSAFIEATIKMLPLLAKTIAGHDSASLGRALVAQLLHLNLRINPSNDIRFNTRLSRFVQSPAGNLIGAELLTPKGLVRVGAANYYRVDQFAKEDTGDTIQEVIWVGAAISLIDDVWWGPTIIDPVSGYNQYNRNQMVKAIPAWLIMDQSYLDKYILGGLFVRQKPSKEIPNEKRIVIAPTLEKLAIPCACKEFFGGPKYPPNPNLGAVKKALFYAIQIYPGDLGTKGGLLTDVSQRVMKEDGSPIPSL
ncbi:unnamed protein product [Clonostachys chloroleuca]|uniref:FAD-dependent oxidoreductase 2 FAD-binding domain-containing protein n=1 Tax=Clonostachys chloroleuca TaxID=1926264 RepID=A0AA35LPX6_9HYPO|nr:unnamed protein product [Clonostachys chloroleuca]